MSLNSCHLLRAYLDLMGAGEQGGGAEHHNHNTLGVTNLSTTLSARPFATALLGAFLAVMVQGGSRLMACEQDYSERPWFAFVSQHFFCETVQSNLSRTSPFQDRQQECSHLPALGSSDSSLSCEEYSLSSCSTSAGALSYDWNQSTEANYHSSSTTVLYRGPYASIRQGLDPHFHSTYSESRQRFQDSIVTSLLPQASSLHRSTADDSGRRCGLSDDHTAPLLPPPPQWIVFSAGAMGSGKTWTFQWLHSKGHFPLQSFVTVDPDQIRQRLPEFAGYVQRCPQRAGERTRKECGLVAEILVQAALRTGRNILVDGSLRNATWYNQYFDQLRREHPHIQLAIVHVVAPREVVLERALVRLSL